MNPLRRSWPAWRSVSGLLVLPLVFSGCLMFESEPYANAPAPYTNHAPALTRAERATVRIVSHWPDFGIQGVDGTPMKSGIEQVWIKPGLRSLLVAKESDLFYRTQIRRVTFDAEAGHVYELSFVDGSDPAGTIPGMWVVVKYQIRLHDATTGTDVDADVSVEESPNPLLQELTGA